MSETIVRDLARTTAGGASWCVRRSKGCGLLNGFITNLNLATGTFAVQGTGNSIAPL